ncbi:MAG: hypothetical protein U0168_21825 [Nannocystaceae bacterium]
MRNLVAEQVRDGVRRQHRRFVDFDLDIVSLQASCPLQFYDGLAPYRRRRQRHLRRSAGHQLRCKQLSRGPPWSPTPT